jgi:putative ABC transport system substrate-binding protein
MQFRQLRRREFLGVLGGAAAAWPLAADAQQQSTRVVGFLSSRAPGESAGLIGTFRKGLRQMGFVEGQNLVIAFRWAEGHYDRLAALAADLVDLHVEVLFAAGGSPSAVAAKAATSTIPVVFTAGDPVHLGLVASLNKPGGNVTGISTLSAELAPKSVELLREMTPAAKVIAYLVNSSKARQSWCDPAGASPAQVRSSVRLVASVAWPLATVVAKRTQRLHGVWD